MSQPPLPWYRRPILPSWFPGWLAACLLVGTAFAVAFGYSLGNPENVCTVAAAAGGFGFGITLAILCVVAHRYRGDRPNPLAPPAVIRDVVMTALIAVFPLMWILDRRVQLPWRRASVTVASGNSAEVCGLAGLLFVVGLVGVTVWNNRQKSGSIRPSLVISLLVALTALMYALIRVLRYHTG